MILALSGLAGAGKSTAAAYLAEHHGFARVRFAGPLKAMLRAFLQEAGMPGPEIERAIEGDTKEAPCDLLGGKSPRFAMQRLGTELGREMLHPDLWVTAWRGAAEKALRFGAPGVVVEDCRFGNEAAAVIAAGGVIVRVERPGLAPIAGDHPSERGVDFTWRVYNDGPPEILHARLDGLVRRVERAA